MPTRGFFGIIHNTMLKSPRVVIDTNVWVSALKSRLGWSFRLISQVGKKQFDHVITVPLVMEYDDVLHRPGMVNISDEAIEDILDYVCATGIRQNVHFLWRPQLTDFKDDMVLEAAVNGQCKYIVTWNVKDFLPAASNWGVNVVTPDAFLKLLLKESI